MQQYTISGLVRFGDSLSTIGDATLAGFDLPTAQRLYGKVGRLDEIAVASSPDVSEPEQLAAASKPVLPPTAQVRTGQAQATRGGVRDERVHHVPAGLPARVRRDRALRRQLRDRELARDHDRAAHARVRDDQDDRRIAKQVLGSIILESLVVGILASVLGLFLGLGLANVLFRSLRRGRVHAAEHRPRLPDAHDRGGAARRHPRDAGRQPPAGDPRDARAADRRGPRGSRRCRSRASRRTAPSAPRC